MRYFVIIVLSFFGLVGTYGRQPDAGEYLFNTNQFVKAKPVYETLVKKRPSDPTYNLRYGICAYETKDYQLALKHLSQVNLRTSPRDLYLARTYYQLYRFQEAADTYKRIIGALKPDDDMAGVYAKELATAEEAADLITRVDDIAIVDTLQVNKSEFLRYFKLNAELGTLTSESLKLSPRKAVDRITYTTQRGDRVIYSDSVHGRMNLFSRYKLLDSWSEPIPLPSVINSSSNENYPFMMLDGVTLYFASDGPKSLGGYDIFVTRFSPGTNTYLDPDNMGFPFNSPANDYMMAIDDLHKVGWFVTDRNQPSGKVMIYTFIPNQVRQPIRSEDDEYLVRAAQLKEYRRAVMTKEEVEEPDSSEQKEEQSSINFVVNDSLIYHSPEQFKSSLARREWDNLNKIQSELNRAKDSLDMMRGRFVTSVNQNERVWLEQQIPRTERRLVELYDDILSKTNMIRSEEMRNRRK